MEIKVFRKYLENCTLSILKIDEVQFSCFCIEDPKQKVKVKGKTCINEGRYEVEYIKQLTPKTKDYRKKFDWFKWHLELKDVPDFSKVYIHIGNYVEDSEGCLLVGSSIHKIGQGTALGSSYMVINSRKTFRLLYKIISERLDKGERVFITISEDSKQIPF